MTDIPPTPRYCPTDTSRKNSGIPHTNIEKKYGIRNAPKQKVRNVRSDRNNL